MFDLLRGADFQTRNLILALRAGEPYRIARALALEAINVSAAGGIAERRVRRILDAAETLAQQVGDPHAHGMVSLATGIAAYAVGRWGSARESFDRADSVLRNRCTGVAWELDTAEYFGHMCLYFLGEAAELSRRLPIVLREAQDRGDLYVVMSTSMFLIPFTHLVADEPDRARHGLSELMGRWSKRNLHIFDFVNIIRQIEIDLYRNDGVSAWRRIAEHRSVLSGSFALRVQVLRIFMLHLRAGSALAATDSLEPGPLLRSAEHDARRLERERMPWSLALARLIRAGVAATRGDRSKAVELLTPAVDDFESLEMRLHAAAARRRLGQLVGGDGGRAMVAQADSWMTGQGIRNPARMTAMIAPWHRD